MNNHNVVELKDRESIIEPLTEMLRDGAQKLIYHAVETELHALLDQYSTRRTGDGIAGVVHNGYLLN